ncbi:MAG: YbaK/EbsC family protein [Nitriliruptorales bacterium]|nr:YbaK/EbsC family protein [Nitriliruptorales bacterium]
MTLVVDHLERRGVRFEVLPHPPATTAQQEAEVLGVSPLEVLKVLVLDTDSGHALAVIPSYRRLDLHLVRRLLGDRGARLATEAEIAARLPEFELGAVPPLPSLLHLPMLIDPEVFRHTKVTFAAGLQRESVRLDPHDLLHGATITVAPIVGPVDARIDPAIEFAAG